MPRAKAKAKSRRYGAGRQGQQRRNRRPGEAAGSTGAANDSNMDVDDEALYATFVEGADDDEEEFDEEVVAGEEWDCPLCSFRNNPLLGYCEVCETAKVRPPFTAGASSGSGAAGNSAAAAAPLALIDSDLEGSDEEGNEEEPEPTNWFCSFCTYKNVGLLPYCEICEAAKPALCRGLGEATGDSVFHEEILAREPPDRDRCPVCSFQNVASRTACEICEAPIAVTCPEHFVTPASTPRALEPASVVAATAAVVAAPKGKAATAAAVTGSCAQRPVVQSTSGSHLAPAAAADVDVASVAACGPCDAVAGTASAAAVGAAKKVESEGLADSEVDPRKICAIPDRSSRGISNGDKGVSGSTAVGAANAVASITSSAADPSSTPGPPKRRPRANKSANSKSGGGGSVPVGGSGSRGGASGGDAASGVHVTAAGRATTQSGASVADSTAPVIEGTELAAGTSSTQAPLAPGRVGVATAASHTQSRVAKNKGGGSGGNGAGGSANAKGVSSAAVSAAATTASVGGGTAEDEEWKLLVSMGWNPEEDDGEGGLEDWEINAAQESLHKHQATDSNECLRLRAQREFEEWKASVVT
eukprot:TRINITY_DN14081_c0_g1_i1.p1 TRINITY_DN14081_c0_g1~~TRINITY_DN14081_c0_g1_i1.p1  ORF type:complete len:626 (-),score=124.46 TRINITY_DN14081_c0_g1_i1:40-1803(-)